MVVCRFVTAAFSRVGLKGNYLARASGFGTMANQKSGAVLGLYTGDKEGEVVFTKALQGFQTSKVTSISDLIQVSGLANKKGKCRVFYGLDPTYSGIAVVSLGKKDAGYSELEEWDERRENIRAGVSAGVRELRDAGVQTIEVDPCGDAEAAAEGANLCIHNYDELKAPESRKCKPKLSVLTSFVDDADSIQAAWQRGVTLAEGQNLARYLMEAPANVMTPTKFAQMAQDTVGKVDKCEVIIRERQWAEEMKMGAFLSVTNGSEEPPKFVEIVYRGAGQDDASFAIVGKGVTFDSGGISLKPSANMDAMRADMGGAACTLASIYTAARLKVPINIRGFIPLCENMPSGKATKPGDVVTAMNGKTIQVDNTDAEGRLILSDALCYAQTFKPSGIIDMATLTGAMVVALGSAAVGVFSNNAQLWSIMHKAGVRTGDRVWRMPVFKHYTKQVTECQLADVNNIGTADRQGGSCTAAAFLRVGARTGDRVWRMPLFKHYTKHISECALADIVNTSRGNAGTSGGACCAAAFLREFVTHDRWMHLDIAGVMGNKGEVPYLTKGMSGRPTRTVVEFLVQLSKEKSE